MATAVSEFVAGARLLGRGLGLVARRRRLFWLGALPPLVMSVLFTAILVVGVINLPAISTALTPFADGWPPNLATLFRLLAQLGLLGGGVLVMVISFSTLTLAIGSPIYDQISEYVDRELEPTLRAPEEPVLTSTARSVRQSFTLIAVSAVVAVLLLVAGLVPVLGQTVVPVVSAIFGGWMLGLELVGSTFERRGLPRLADRRAAMRRRRARTLGMAVPTFLLLAVPFLGVVVFPVATAAGTLLARDLLATDPQRRFSAPTQRS